MIPLFVKAKKFIQKIPLSVNVYHGIKSLCLYPSFLLDYLRYRKLDQQSNRELPTKWGRQVPCLLDKTEATSFEPHYIYHPAWAYRKILSYKPQKHVDISSTLHFCTMISAVIPTEFYDYRPAKINLSGLTMHRADLTKLPFSDNSIGSLSCMHTLEHIGLGRYGDPIDPGGDVKAAKELARVLAPGGSLIIVVPVGRPKIEFNAHRIYSYEMVRKLFSDLTLEEFSLVSDNFKEEGFITDADPSLVEKQSWGCGCFWFKK